MKKRLVSLALALIMALSLLPMTMGAASAAEAEFSLSETNITVPLGGGTNVSVKFGNGVEARTVEWSQKGGSCKIGRARDGSSITAYGIKVGVTTMTARTLDGKYTATCTITVVPRANPGTDRVAGQGAVFTYPCFQYVGRSYEPLDFAVRPSNIDWDTLLWSSSDESVATVNNRGVVTCKGKGVTRIEVTTALNTKNLWYWDIEVLPALSSLPPNPEVALPPATSEDAGLVDVDCTAKHEGEVWRPAGVAADTAKDDVPLTDAEFNELVIRVAKNYDINLVRDDGYELTHLGMMNIEGALERLDTEFVKSLSKTVSKCYRSDLYIHLQSQEKGGTRAGLTEIANGRTTVYLYGFPNYSTVGHEFGHVIHCAIYYFDRKFGEKFAAANGGRAYGTAMSGDDEQYFVSNYGKKNVVEDMATIFTEMFMTKKADAPFALKLAAGYAGLLEKTALFRTGANNCIGRSPVFGTPLFKGNQGGVNITPPDAGEDKVTMQASQSEISLKVGATHSKLTPLFSDQVERTFTMTSSNPEVAKVEGTKVTGVAPGVATITLKAGSGQAECQITVWNAAAVGLSVATQPTKVNYLVGEAFDTTGLTFTYSDGVTSTPVDISKIKFTVHTTTITAGRPFTEAGVKEVVATYNVPGQAYAAKFTLRVTKPGDNQPVSAVPSPTKLTVNGVAVAADAYAINQNNYIKLRDLAYIINGTGKNFEVKWDGSKNAINLLSKTAYTPVGGELAKGDGQSKTATLATSAIYVDGVEKQLTAYVIGQNNYFKLRDVMQAFDVAVGYDGATGTATLDTSKGYDAPAEETVVPPNERPASDEFESRAYYIELAGAAKQYFDIVGRSRNDGADLCLYAKSGAANQRFVLTPVGTLYALKCVESGKMLTVPSSAAGTQVVQQTYTEAENQLFTITKNSDGSVRFQTADGLFLGVKGGSSKNGTAIVTGAATTDGSQNFFLKKP